MKITKKYHIERCKSASHELRELEKLMFDADGTKVKAFKYQGRTIIFDLGVWSADYDTIDMINEVFGFGHIEDINSYTELTDAEQAVLKAAKSGELQEWLETENCGTACCAFGFLKMTPAFKNDFTINRAPNISKEFLDTHPEEYCDEILNGGFETLAAYFGINKTKARHWFDPAKYSEDYSTAIRPSMVADRIDGFVAEYEKENSNNVQPA